MCLSRFTFQRKNLRIAGIEYVCCGLLPYTTYTFSVECHAGKINDAKGIWSDTKSVNISTAEAGEMVGNSSSLLVVPVVT